MNISQHWRLKSQRYQLSDSTKQQDADVFPPRPQVEQREMHYYNFHDAVEAGDMNEIHPKLIEMELLAAR